MIAIKKSPDVPEKLRREQTKIATRFFEKKETLTGKQNITTAEFSLLGKCMVRDFERFFIEGLDWVRENEGLKKLLRFAYRLHFP